MNEIEIKAKIKNKTLLTNKLSEFGIKLAPPVLQEDSIYFPLGITFENIHTEIPVQRIRQTQGRTILTLKVGRSKDNHLDKIEYETEVKDASVMHQMLEVMGYYESSNVKKERTKGLYKDYELCLDTVEGLGDYIEIEYQTELLDIDSREIQETMWKFLESLGVSREDEETVGYDIILYRSQRGL